ncbi:MAG TPA: patatin-like phospholipase family protein [Kofleriaceae bacterium]|jgi:NTE family protein
MSKALVLAGGGVAGIAWLLGAIESLGEAGVNLADADVIIGTSAGANCAAQIGTGQLAAAIAMQEQATSSEIAVQVDLAALWAKFAELAQGATSEREVMQRYAAYALSASTVGEAERKVAVAARLPVKTWPERALKITAVDAQSGELVAFDRDSGVSLLDAVTASSAVPGVWPPATINGRRYCDGGMRSFSNADLARGQDRVAILVPVATSEMIETRLAAERAQLASSFVLAVDAATAAVIGPNPLDPSRRKPALDEGRRQGRAAAHELAAYWA